MKIINWGIIGCGDVTEVKSGPGFQKASNSSLVAVMRRNAELARDYARRHNVPKWYDRADQLISDPAVDAVYIATPPSTHKEYTIMVAKAGKPVYVEKPMALHYDESLIMIEVCRQAKVPLFVAYYRRALPRFLKIKSLIENNSIGEVRFVNITFHQPPAEKDLYGEKHWRVDPEIAGCGYFCTRRKTRYLHNLNLNPIFMAPEFGILLLLRNWIVPKLLVRKER
jgi:predicted dehydrogenase